MQVSYFALKLLNQPFPSALMKRTLSFPRRNASSGFTLVELLVVIGIIAILASAVTVAASSAIKAAKRAKAANTANQIQTAVLGYYTEYSVYPVPTGTTTDYKLTDASTSAADWGVLIKALCGNINPYDASAAAATTISNSRSIAFLSLKKADVDSLANPAPLNPLPLEDGTAKYFNILIDSDYDGVLGTGTVKMPNLASATSGTDPVDGGTSTAGVAVWANCNGSKKTKNPAFWVKTY